MSSFSSDRARVLIAGPERKKKKPRGERRAYQNYEEADIVPSFAVAQLPSALDCAARRRTTRTSEKKFEAISRWDPGPTLTEHNCQNVVPILSRDGEIKRGEEKLARRSFLCARVRSRGCAGVATFLRVKCRSKVTATPRPSLPSETSVNSTVEGDCRSVPAVERETASKVARPRDTALF